MQRNMGYLRQPGQTEITQLPVPTARDVRTVSGSFEQLIDPSRHENQNFGDYVFAQLTEVTDAGQLYPTEKLRTLFPRLLGLSFTHSQGEEFVEIGTARKRLDPADQFALFYKAMTGQELDGTQSAIIAQACKEADTAKVVDE